MGSPNVEPAQGVDIEKTCCCCTLTGKIATGATLAGLAVVAWLGFATFVACTTSNRNGEKYIMFQIPLFFLPTVGVRIFCQLLREEEGAWVLLLAVPSLFYAVLIPGIVLLILGLLTPQKSSSSLRLWSMRELWWYVYRL